MPKRQRDRSLGDGVFYAQANYVGVGLRLLIVMIDFVLLLVAYIIIFNLFLWNATLLEPVAGWFWLAFVIAVWAYLTILKATFGTVGYFLTGAKIVNLRGKRPSVFRMTFRLFMWIFGPFHFLFDLLWCSIDQDRQSLRDRFAGTYVIKRGAVPIGKGEVHLSYYHAMGFTLSFPWVTRPKAKTSAAPNET